MADYIYLLENRLSAAQQRALSVVRKAVRARDLTFFLTGGAVRDLTGGGSVRDLDITVQGDVSGLQLDMEAAGAAFTGENPPAQSLFFTLHGGVRVEISSAMAVTFPNPGQPKYEPASITDDLRRRDFTANAMALSLNEGSYGLLMDPLNGVADIENRELRLVSNYGFIDDPARLVRAVRLSSRLGWQMEDRTRQRYENAKEDDAIASLSGFARGYELEEVFHEEDPLRILRALDGEGWLKALSPQLVLGKANEPALAELREKQGLLQTQGILADPAALAFPLLVAKLQASEISSLKSSFARPGFAAAIDASEERTRELQARLSAKEASTPSIAWRILHEAEPNVVLSLFYSSKSGTVQSRIKTFLNESPSARQRLPYGLMQEMRITPDMPVYNELLDKLFFELMDGKLQTTEELKTYMEPYSPPAPPPPLNLRRARAKKEARPSRAKSKKAATVVEQEELTGVAEGLMQPGTLTGPDHGTEPETAVPLEGKVAPLAPGEEDPLASIDTPVVKTPTKKTAKAPRPAAEKAPSVTSGAATELPVDAPAKKLTAKPAPAPEADALTPHPEATETISKQPALPVPVRPEPVKLTEVVARKGKEKAASVAPPDKKAAKTVAAPKPTPLGSKTAAESADKSSSIKPEKAVPVTSGSAKKPEKATPKKAQAKAAPQKKSVVKAPAKAAAKKLTVKGQLAAPASKSAGKTSKPASAKTAAKPVTKAAGKSGGKAPIHKAAAKKAVPAKAAKSATKSPAKRR